MRFVLRRIVEWISVLGGWVSVITVASVPANHVYVRHLGDPSGDGDVRRLADPRPCGAPSDHSVWWPPVMLDPGWVRRHHAEFDVFHVHFGFDAQPVAGLEELVRVLRVYDKPLIYTAHDLRNPHHPGRAAHDEQLDVLIPAAHRVVTLTAGATEVIRQRWGRTALVLPHPHVVDFPALRRPRRRGDEFVVGVHLQPRHDYAADLHRGLRAGQPEDRPEVPRPASGSPTRPRCALLTGPYPPGWSRRST